MESRGNLGLYAFLRFIGSLLICSGGLSFAANNSPFNDDDWNTMVFETYYPSPYGEYQELRSYYLTVGSGYLTAEPGDGNMVVSGTVGIGTSSPDTSYKLDINGKAKVSDELNANKVTAGEICLSGTCKNSFSSGSGTQNKIAKWTSGSDLGDSSIQDDGSNILIGGIPAQSGYNFAVSGSGYFSGFIQAAGTGSNNYFNDKVYIRRPSSSSPSTYVGLDVEGTINAATSITSSKITASSELCIQGSCRTSWPSGGSSGVTSIYAGSGISVSANTGSVTVNATGVQITNPDVVYGKTTSSGVGHLTKWATTYGIMDSTISEDSNYRISVGTPSTTLYKLNVGGGGYFEGDVLIKSGNWLCFGTDCRNSWSGGGSGSSNQWQTSGSDIYYNAGKVGIGTSGSPSKKLEVSGGNALFNGMVGIGTSASVSGDFPGVYLDVAGASAGNTIARFRGGKVAMGKDSADSDSRLDVNGKIKADSFGRGSCHNVASCGNNCLTQCPDGEYMVGCNSGSGSGGQYVCVSIRCCAPR